MLLDANYNYLASYWRSGKINNQPRMLSPSRFFFSPYTSPELLFSTSKPPFAAVVPNRLSS
jgi:hypothetical protein